MIQLKISRAALAIFVAHTLTSCTQDDAKSVQTSTSSAVVATTTTTQLVPISFQGVSDLVKQATVEVDRLLQLASKAPNKEPTQGNTSSIVGLMRQNIQESRSATPELKTALLSEIDLLEKASETPAGKSKILIASVESPKIDQVLAVSETEVAWKAIVSAQIKLKQSSDALTAAGLENKEFTSEVAQIVKDSDALGIEIDALKAKLLSTSANEANARVQVLDPARAQIKTLSNRVKALGEAVLTASKKIT